MARMSSGSRPLFQRNIRSFRQWPSLLTKMTVRTGSASGVQGPAHGKGLGKQLQAQAQVVLGELAAGELHPHEEQAGVRGRCTGPLLRCCRRFQQKPETACTMPGRSWQERVRT
jgi:hypothetical protein